MFTLLNWRRCVPLLALAASVGAPVGAQTTVDDPNAVVAPTRYRPQLPAMPTAPANEAAPARRWLDQGKAPAAPLTHDHANHAHDGVTAQRAPAGQPPAHSSEHAHHHHQHEEHK